MSITAQIDEQNLTVSTTGAENLGLPNLRTQVTHPDLLTPAAWLLESLYQLHQAQALNIADGQVFTQGYWLCKFVGGEPGLLDVWECHPNGTGYRPVIDLTVQFWVLQSAVCEKHGADFTPPHLGQMCQVAEELLQEGEPVAIEAIRFPAPAPDSGWVFFPLGQAGQSLLQNARLHTVTTALPDLAPFLALPHGYRVAFVAGEPKVWLDPEIANHIQKEGPN